MEQFLKRFSTSKAVQDLARSLSSRRGRYALCGLRASAWSLFAAAAAKRLSDRLHVFLFADKQRAIYFYNDLELLLSQLDVPQEDKRLLFYPASYTHQTDSAKVENANVVMRNMVLQKLLSKDAQILVTYPQAFAEKVVSAKKFSSKMLRVSVGQERNLDDFVSKLEDYGFERVAQVCDAGQFSLRGGIVDVYSFSSQMPLRIEFFGDEVESIRTFDIATQLSVEQKQSADILAADSETKTLVSRVGLSDYLPEDAVFWIEDRRLCMVEIEKLQGESNEEECPFVERKAVENFLKERLTIDMLPKQPQESENYTQVFSSNCEAQMQFNSQFSLLVAELEKWFEQSYDCYFGVSDEKQKHRLEKLLQDFTPEGHVLRVNFISGGFYGGFIDHDRKLLFYTDHQIFNRYHATRLNDNSDKRELLTMEDLLSLKPGDYVTHIDYGVGKFGGLEKITNNGKQQEAIRLVYKDNDLLYISIHSLHEISRYSGKDGAEPKLNRLGSTAWQKLKNKTKSKVKDIAKELIALYAQRKATKGFAFSADTYLQDELEASFLYEDTPDQYKATRDVKRDMESPCPMDRLVCGDVGFGKTEVAIRAAFKAVCDGKQVVVLVPTTVLAFQHYQSFSSRLERFACKVDYLNRFRSRTEVKQVLKDVQSGKTDILIGTHRVLSKDVKFKDLGLLIIDEEHKFGVSVKEKLKTMKVNLDTLTLTATPIPRTLQFSLMGARDLSVINTAPKNRRPVETQIISFDMEKIRDVIAFELARGGQVYFVHNRVQNIEQVAALVRQLVPEAKVIVGHGQMAGEELERIMLDFIEGRYDVLVSTTIVENGLDIPNANTIIIDDAQNYGLSDLHQLRGRVGRSNRKAFCYLIAPDASLLTEEASKRLRAIEEFSAIGSGFAIAMRDLDIRGAGNILGAEQSGFISEIGYDTYQKILNEALHELKTTEFKDLFSAEADAEGFYTTSCKLETDLEIFIPDSYISDTVERLKVYKRLDGLEEEADAGRMKAELEDRFGKLPKETEQLFHVVRLRRLARSLAIEKLTLKREKLTALFVSDKDNAFFKSEKFEHVLYFVQCYPSRCALQETATSLTLSLSGVKDIQSAVRILQTINEKGVGAI